MDEFLTAWHDYDARSASLSREALVEVETKTNDCLPHAARTTALLRLSYQRHLINHKQDWLSSPRRPGHAPKLLPSDYLVKRAISPLNLNFSNRIQDWLIPAFYNPAPSSIDPPSLRINSPFHLKSKRIKASHLPRLIVRKLATPTTHISRATCTMDPFEVRMRFNSQLQHLNASVTSAQKTAAYALKYREWDEDLHSCILENLERNSLNNRANIFYFFETLCDVAAAAHHIEFVRMMERDILRIVDLVAPEDGSGAANVKVVRKVLRNLAGKKYLQQQTVDELEDCIKDRDQIGGVGGAASPEEAMRYSNGNVRVEKRQVEQRIEEDRERHKRLRENIWAVNHASAEDEFGKWWAETPDGNEDDYRMAAEEVTENKQYARLHRSEQLRV